MNLRRLLLFNLPVLFLPLPEDHSGYCLEADWKPRRPRISHLQANNITQSLVVRWLVDRSGLLEKGYNYEIQIGRTEALTIIYKTNVSAHPVGSDVYTWTWTSPLPLECANHSVRIRCFYNQSIPSPWSEWMTNSGAQHSATVTKMFPFQRLLREGSSAMLCCIPPRGVHITSMAFSDTKYPLINIGDGVKAISVKNLTIPRGVINGVFLSCNDTTAMPQYCINYVTFPPQKPRNLSCKTADLTTVTCSWTPGRKSNLHGRYRRTHALHIENFDQIKEQECTESSCSFSAVPHIEEYNISVVVKNDLGEERESYSFNISDRVFPVVQWDRVRPGVTDTTVSWIIQGNLSGLTLLCQVVTNPESTAMVLCQNVSHCEVKLENLLPNTHYSARVCCAVKSKAWGDWAPRMRFTTYPLVTLDIWRTIKQLPYSHNLRIVTLLWTPQVAGSTGYKVQWSQGGQYVTKDSGETHADISIGPGQCDITVQAVVKHGSSIPAHITIPQMEDRGNLLREQRVSGSTAGGFHLAWAKQDNATCGYTVEWCRVGTAIPCDLQWMKVPANNNTLFLPAQNFKASYRYTFNIYGCMENGHKLLEIQTGYSQELRPVQTPSLVEPVRRTSSSVTLEWHYNEDDQAHPGFITGYLVAVQKEEYLLNVSVADPRRKSVTIEHLQENQEYTFHLSALTKAGPGPANRITIRTKVNNSFQLAVILTPLLLLLGCTMLLWPQRKMLTNVLKGIFVYPAGMNIKTIELDNFLHETSERLQSETVEECVSCDIEILNAKPSRSETTTLIDREHPPSFSASTFPSFSPICMPLQTDYCPQSTAVLRESPVLQQITSIANRSYFDIVEDFSGSQDASKDISEITCLEPSEKVQESWSVVDDYISNDALSM
ncbi:leukemia inhibitory factor receptor [Diretmus argenteus]